MKHHRPSFSIYEWLIVIMVVGVILIFAMGYYAQLANESRRLKFQALAHNFSTAVTLSHAHWLIQKVNGAAQPAMVIDNVEITFNQAGWPVNAGSQSSPDSEVCQRLWHGLLQGSSAAIESWQGLLQASAIIFSKNKTPVQESQFRISLLSKGWCRYELVNQDKKHYFFDYFLKTGRVVISAPK